MSVGRMLEAAMTMALGGVATGSMKAYEQHRVAGIMRYSGWMCMAEAWAQSSCFQGQSVN